MIGCAGQRLGHRVSNEPVDGLRHALRRAPVGAEPTGHRYDAGATQFQALGMQVVLGD